MNWIPDRTDSGKVWPHKVLNNKLLIDGQIKVKKNNSTIRTFDLNQGTIDLASQMIDPWDALKFETHLSFDEEEYDILDVCESEKDVKAMMIVNSQSSKFQDVFISNFELPVTHVSFELDRSNLFSRILIEPMIVLSTDYEQDISDDFAYAKSSVLATALPLTIITDFDESSFGGGINEAFEPFDRSEKHALFKLRYDTDAENNMKPCVVWNTRNRLVIEQIHVRGKEGSGTILRDSIIRSVAPFFALQLLVGIDPEHKDEYDPESPEMKVVESIGKMLGGKNTSEVFMLLKDLRRMEDSSIAIRLQHYFKTGSTLDKLIEKGPEGVE